jgi:AcrR family transcriptional regulator
MPKSSLQKIREAPASTKARILEAAEAVFATRGFEGASTREIASRAGVNISSLHYHWESKETLYFAVFRNVYDRLIEISARSVVPKLRGGEPAKAAREDSVARLFDFFLDNPNVPRLLLRRILENEEFGGEIERDILVPAWKTFAGWVQEYTGRKIRDIDAQILMLTVHSTLLLFTLDSRQYGHILGGGMRDPEIARRVRSHLTRLTALLVEAPSRPERS